MKTFNIITLGCKVNQCESNAIANDLLHAGWQRKKSDADLCIINTCAVTGKASMQSRQAVRKAIKSNLNAKIVVTGCYAQTFLNNISDIKGVHFIVGHSEKQQIPEIITEVHGVYPAVYVKRIGRERIFREMTPAVSTERTRAFLKIQDGCNDFCSYCIVPYARGRSRSLPIQNVMDALTRLNEAEYKEVVLTGIHLGCYGLDFDPKIRLYDLLKLICKERPVYRIRLSSIEPVELDDDIINLVSSSNALCKHFHIPLQSGDDDILEKMRRPYDSILFSNLVNKIKDKICDAAIGVDVLAGFPGETETAFENTYQLIESLPVTYLHVFPFSPRKGTPAAGYSDHVSSMIVKKRTEKLRNLGSRKKRDFYASMLGKSVEALIEGPDKKLKGMMKSISSNYMPIFVEGDNSMRNNIVSTEIVKVDEENRVFGNVT